MFRESKGLIKTDLGKCTFIHAVWVIWAGFTTREAEDKLDSLAEAVLTNDYLRENGLVVTCRDSKETITLKMLDSDTWSVEPFDCRHTDDFARKLDSEWPAYEERMRILNGYTVAIKVS